MLSKLYATGEQLESAALAIASRLGPWLGPIPTAFLVAVKTGQHLDWPPWVSGVAAISLELLGIATTTTAMSFWVYNQGRTKQEPEAPVVLPIVLAAIYFFSAIVLTVILDLAALPASEIGAANYAPALFPFLSIVSVMVLAIRRANPGFFMTRRERREAAKAEIVAVEYNPLDFACWCGEWQPDGRHKTPTSAKSALSQHQRGHKREAKRIGHTLSALKHFEQQYKDSRLTTFGGNGDAPELPGIPEVAKWITQSS